MTLIALLSGGGGGAPTNINTYVYTNNPNNPDESHVNPFKWAINNLLKTDIGNKRGTGWIPSLGTDHIISLLINVSVKFQNFYECFGDISNIYVYSSDILF